MYFIPHFVFILNKFLYIPPQPNSQSAPDGNFLLLIVQKIIIRGIT